MIEIILPESPVVHGDKFKFTVKWENDRPLTQLKVALECRYAFGDRNRKDKVFFENIDNPGMSGEETFSWQLPSHPYSFHGEKVSIKYLIRVKASPWRSGKAEKTLTAVPREGMSPLIIGEVKIPDELGLPWMFKHGLKNGL